MMSFFDDGIFSAKLIPLIFSTFPNALYRSLKGTLSSKQTLADYQMILYVILNKKWYVSKMISESFRVTLLEKIFPQLA